MTKLTRHAVRAVVVALTTLTTLVALGGVAVAGPAPLDEGSRAGGGSPPATDAGTDWATWGLYAGAVIIVVGLVGLLSILTVRHRHAGVHA